MNKKSFRSDNNFEIYFLAVECWMDISIRLDDYISNIIANISSSFTIINDSFHPAMKFVLSRSISL